MDRRTRTSKFLSYILRHHPKEIGLTLDAGGWADVETLVASARRHGRPLDRALVEEVVRHDSKERFSLSRDGAKIRANYGHSVDVDLGIEASVPPEELYHGTAARFTDAIRREGLRPGSRQYVHLSPDAETARAVGARHGRPVVLTIRSRELHTRGQCFYRAEGGTWLTDRVPVSHIRFPASTR